MSLISRSPDRKTRMSPGPAPDSSSIASLDGLALVAVLAALDGAVAHLDRVGPAGHLDDRRAAEGRGEPLRVDGRRGDDHLEVRAGGQQLPQAAEDEVDVQAALVRLVDDQRVIAAQLPVAGQFGQQDAVGHHLDQRVAGRHVGEPDLVADRLRRAGCRVPRRSARPRVRAASRRGWVWPICPVTPRPSSRQILGIWVVLPEPVSPAMITTWWSRMASAISSLRWLTGSSGG